MKSKIESLQVLRGLAALAVVLYHYNLYLVPNGVDREIPDKLFGWGAIGVDLFFVISGFIMVFVTHNKTSGIKTSAKFIINRLVRVLPTYYSILFLTIFGIGGIDLILNLNLDSDPNFTSALTFQPYVADTAPLYIPGSGLYNIRWTLNYEIYFYFAFALCLLFKPRIIILSLWFLLPIAFSIYSIHTFTLSTQGYEFESVKLRFLTNPIILEFGIGVFSGYAYLNLRDKDILKSGYISLALISIVSLGIAFGIFKAYSLISAIAFFFIVLIFSIQSEKILKITPRFFITLGDISFSWYLIHTPLLYVASIRFDKHFPGAINSFVGFFTLILISIMLAWLSHRYIEIKLTNVIRDTIKIRFFSKSAA
ncbi:TPA: acyltransferase [Escherichia coli]|uniref:acyltransferase family protein n=1 Tax=Escherichia coli TaxID=562 RepID=UPI0018E13AAC|nr:acyltransferase family protein [Escherichia coli]MBI1121884.1 acyltransferase [Escherichia coli]MEC4250953.1 acyltransferase [Escherichia coli]HAW3070564.1 acyltransferase [Escherichia coli]